MNIDPIDDDWPNEPHLDPDELNDLQLGDEEMKQLLNDLDKGVVGSEKPRVEHIFVKDSWDWYEQDNNPASPLEQDWL